MNLVWMYIGSMIGYIIVAIPIYIVSRRIYIKKNHIQVHKVHEIILGLFVMYLVGLASQTIIPRWDCGIISATGEFYFNMYPGTTKINIIPFHTIYEYVFSYNSNVSDWGSVSLLNLLANIFLFSPLGIFIPILWEKWQSIKKVTFLGLCITVFIEFIQFFIGRSVDIDDVILNTIGVIIGYGIFYLLKVIRCLKHRFN